MDEVEFDAAASHLERLTSSGGNNEIDDADLLYLYARYKQSTVGKCNIPKPGFLNFTGKKKWQAWSDLKDMDDSTAMEEYIMKVKMLDPTWKFDETKTVSSSFGVKVSTLNNPLESDEVPDCDKSIVDWCQEGSLMMVKKLFDENNLYIDEENRTILHWACDRDHFEIAQFLLQQNHPVNCRDSEELTPLHYASSCGNMEIVRLLVNGGADLAAVDSDGESPVDCAASSEIGKYLREKLEMK